jgi:hypothetical protein
LGSQCGPELFRTYHVPFATVIGHAGTAPTRLLDSRVRVPCVI